MLFFLIYLKNFSFPKIYLKTIFTDSDSCFTLDENKISLQIPFCLTLKFIIVGLVKMLTFI